MHSDKTKRNSRIGLRLSQGEREQIEILLRRGKFKNLSQVIQEALKQFFNSE